MSIVIIGCDGITELQQMSFLTNSVRVNQMINKCNVMKRRGSAVIAMSFALQLIVAIIIKAVKIKLSNSLR